MASFRNDYSTGAHPKVMQALLETNMEVTPGYGADTYCERAQALIREKFCCPKAEVHFLVGGTITNLCAISAFLRPWEAVIAATTGHISIHEAGAIEACGHQIRMVQTPDGKLRPEDLYTVVAQHTSENDELYVLPKLVYISDATELGTIYTKSELAALSAACRELGLLLYLDGARLAMALCADENDVAASDLAKYCDAFFIGGTKNGLLFGEALVIVNERLQSYVRKNLRQRGAIIAKGRLLGIQFLTILEDDLWLTIGKTALGHAKAISEALVQKGYTLYAKSPTNQLFPIVTNAQYEMLHDKFGSEYIEKIDDARCVCRLVTSWSTTQEDVDALIAAL